MEIVRAVGIPLRISKATLKQSQFARLLVEIDLDEELNHTIHVHREVYSFLVNVKYENIPTVCLNCNIIGHSDKDCTKERELPDVEDHFLYEGELFTPDMCLSSSGTSLSRGRLLHRGVQI